MRQILAVLIIGLAVVLLGCGGGGGQPVPPSQPSPSDTNPPTIRDVRVEPMKLTRFTGGEVKISARVSDPSGVAEVWAEVKKPDGTMVKVTMNLAGEVYQGAIMASANIRSDGKDETYLVWVRAKDGKGNETPKPGEPSVGISFTVPAPLNPPEKPPGF